MVITRQIGDLNRVVYRFALYTSYGDGVSIYIVAYTEQSRKTKQQGWASDVSWVKGNRSRSTIDLSPDVPQDVYNELISSIKFNPQFNVRNI